TSFGPFTLAHSLLPSLLRSVTITWSPLLTSPTVRAASAVELRKRTRSGPTKARSFKAPSLEEEQATSAATQTNRARSKPRFPSSIFFILSRRIEIVGTALCAWHNLTARVYGQGLKVASEVADKRAQLLECCGSTQLPPCSRFRHNRRWEKAASSRSTPQA